MRLVAVVGARPNFMKVAPLLPALAAAGIQTDLVHTGQHYDAAMSEVFFKELGIQAPRWNLGVASGTHASQTGTAMIALEEVFARERPDAVLVVGDVNSTMAGALAAVKLGIPILHLEAGLRSRDMSMPEEVNRLVTDQLSTLLLTPTLRANENLLAEGIPATRIQLVGNIMAQTLLEALPRVLGVQPSCKFGLEPKGYVLATIHRPENTDEPESFREVLSALQSSSLPVLFPVHPRTRCLLEDVTDGESQVRLIEPVPYSTMIALQRDAAAVITDSGGMQEEACMLHTPCVTVRRNTEREITVELGANELVSASAPEISRAIATAIVKPRDWPLPELWDAQVSARVVEAITRAFA
ncbi:MAG: UDP-N-acetylglucosamine 2-epimerase (non-hydrolyzing) [Actinomycetota bacterium]|nr:UDP-N-acetylglucosamine 2-epimerase (non-hydrolyzing) [Actinomycetota bacterium]